MARRVFKVLTGLVIAAFLLHFGAQLGFFILCFLYSQMPSSFVATALLTTIAVASWGIREKHLEGRWVGASHSVVSQAG